MAFSPGLFVSGDCSRQAPQVLKASGFDPLHPRFPKLNQVLRRLGINLSWHSILGRAAISNLIPQSQNSGYCATVNSSNVSCFHANSQATLSYVPKHTRTELPFRTNVQASMAKHDSTLGWSELTVEGVEVHIVPGNHLTMLRKPNVQALAEQLKVCISAK